jgi:hypothetical protein
MGNGGILHHSWHRHWVALLSETESTSTWLMWGWVCPRSYLDAVEYWFNITEGKLILYCFTELFCVGGRKVTMLIYRTSFCSHDNVVSIWRSICSCCAVTTAVLMKSGIIPEWLIGVRVENHGLNLRGNFAWASIRNSDAQPAGRMRSVSLVQFCPQLNYPNEELKILRLK